MLIPSKKLNVYFRKFLNDFVFSEMSPELLGRFDGGSVLMDVPVPIDRETVQAMSRGEGLSIPRLAENMTLVVGADPEFRFAEKYAGFMQRVFGGKAHEGMNKAGEKCATDGNMEKACVYFRAALLLEPDYFEAMYSYAMTCREIYMAAGDEEKIGFFKAEAFRYLESVTELYPDFADAFYFLGYAYINMGLYSKAGLTWESFLEKSDNTEQREEILERMEQLREPIEIERGVNEVAAGRFDSGIAVLERYKTGDYDKWWPLHYYLGIGYSAAGKVEESIESFKRVLAINPSHVDSMEELADIYAALGDAVNEKKYREKIKILTV